MANISVRRGVERLGVGLQIAAVKGLRASPHWIRAGLPIAAWAATAIFLGLVIGVAAVLLPPTGAFGIVAVAGLLLLWVMPDLPRAPVKSVRYLFFAMFIVMVCVPNYYTIQVSSLPWISARRAMLFPLIILFSLTISISSAARGKIYEVLSTNKSMAIGAVGFFVTIILSIFTSQEPTGSLSGATEAMFAWLVPFITTIYIVSDDNDVEKVARIIAYSAIIICVLGVCDFVTERRLALGLMPSGLLERLIEANESIARMVHMPQYRNGAYRASSIFFVSLSFGEFAGMMSPIGAYFLFNSSKGRDRALGALVLILCVAGLYSSGSRGGYQSFFVGAVVFASVSYLRLRKFDPHSMVSPIMGAVATVGFACAIVLVVFWPRAHAIVLGTSADASSTDERYAQWDLAVPHILSNPLTGHGFDLGADIIGLGAEDLSGGSVDSYPISLLVETGVPSFLLFVLAAFSAVWYGVKRGLDDPSRDGALNAALASTIAGFLIYRLVLSQLENFTLVFVIYGMIMTSRTIYLKRHAAAKSETVAASPIQVMAKRRRGETRPALVR